MENKYDLEDLKADPIFAISLSSNELFHSNFWAWLFKRNIEYVRIFFPEIGSVEQVKREESHRDISIWQDESTVFVIENKFKSIPTEEQLVAYQDALKGSFCKGVLTGLLEPDFVGGMEKWEFLPYDKIGKDIVEKADELEKDAFLHDLISRYGNLLQNLYKVLVSERDRVGETWGGKDTKDAIEKFEEIRLHSIFEKLMADSLTAYLNENLHLEQEVNGYRLKISSYYGNAGAGVDVRYTNENLRGKTIPRSIGVQIEMKQYRIVAEWGVFTPKVKKNSSSKKYKLDLQCTGPLFKSMQDKTWFVKYDDTSRKNITFHAGGLHSTGLNSSGYCGYGSDDVGIKSWTFLYQYWKTDSISFAEICRNVKQDMKYAHDEVLSKIAVDGTAD